MASFSSKFLKKRFAAPGKLSSIADRASQFVAQLDKPVQGGASVAEAVIISGVKGNSYSLPAAKFVANSNGTSNPGHDASNYDEFVSSFGEYHGIANVSARAVAGGKTNLDAYLRQLNEVVETEVQSFASVGARKMLGPIGGSIGRILATNGGGTAGEYTLTVASDAWNFQAGQVLQAADGDGNGAPANVRAALGYVIGVTPDNDTGLGHVQLSASSGGALGSPALWANNDYLFRNGDIAASQDLSDVQIRSLQAWITLTAASTTYNGVNRNQDSRLSGFRVPTAQTSGMSILDRIQLLATTGRAQAGAQEANLCVVGPRTWQQLATEAQSFGQATFTKNIKIGVELLTVMTCNGPTQVINDPHCLESDIWLVSPKHLKLYNYDGFPALDEGDGNEILRQTDAAGYEVRWHAFTSLTVNGRPHFHGRCDSGNT